MKNGNDLTFDSNKDVLEYFIQKAEQKGLKFQQIDDSANSNGRVRLKRIYSGKNDSIESFCNVYEAASSIMNRANLKNMKALLDDYFLNSHKKSDNVDEGEEQSLSLQIYNSVVRFLESQDEKDVEFIGVEYLQMAICSQIKKVEGLSSVDMKKYMSDFEERIFYYLKSNYDGTDHSTLVKRMKKTLDIIQKDGCWRGDD